jgi:hypothetical protein
MSSLKWRIQRLEQQKRPDAGDTAADEYLLRRIRAARQRVAENRGKEARQKEEKEAA